MLKDGPYDGKLQKVKIEQLFIETLESIDDNDAEILVNMILKKPIIGIPISVIEKAFPEFYSFKIF